MSTGSAVSCQPSARVPGDSIMIMYVASHASHGMQVLAMLFLVEGATCANRGKLLHFLECGRGCAKKLSTGLAVSCQPSARVPGDSIMIMYAASNASHGMQVLAMVFLVEGATCANRCTHHSCMVPHITLAWFHACYQRKLGGRHWPNLLST